MVTIIDEFQINEINVDLRTSGFDNEVHSVDACAVWWERESFYCLPRIGVVTWHREPRFQCGSARTGSIWNSSIACFCNDVANTKSALSCNYNVHTMCPEIEFGQIDFEQISLITINAVVPTMNTQYVKCLGQYIIFKLYRKLWKNINDFLQGKCELNLINKCECGLKKWNASAAFQIALPCNQQF